MGVPKIGDHAVQTLRKGLITAGLSLALLSIGSLSWTAASSSSRGVPLASPSGGAVESPMALGLSGTATAVGPGLLLTNSHVVSGCRRQGRTLRVAGLSGGWEVRFEDPDVDLALLEGGAARGSATLPIWGGTRMPKGSKVTIIGFPAQGDASAVQLSPGTVLRAGLTIRDAAGERAGGFVLRDNVGREIEPTWADGLRYYGAERADRMRWTLEVDAVVPAGSSGGAVVDAAGNLVGIVFAADIRRGITSVVPLEDVRDFLRRAEVHPRFGTRSGSDVRATELSADRRGLEQITVKAVHQIRC